MKLCLELAAYLHGEQRLTRLQVALRRRDHIAAEAGGRSGRLTAEHGGCNADAELEPDHVVGAIERSVASCLIGLHAVLGEALHGVVGARLERDPDTPAQVALDLSAVAVQAGRDFNRRGARQLAALAARPVNVLQGVDAYGWEEQAL